MGYEIVYGRQFVKCEHGILPLVLCGSNNCTMFYGGKEIRERDWTTFLGRRDTVAMSAEQIMEQVYKYVPSKYQQHFMRGGKWVDDKAFASFFQNGIKSARTIEEIIKDNPAQELHCYLTYYLRDEDRWPAWEKACEAHIYTTVELDNWIEQAEAEYAILSKEHDSVYICTKFWGIKPLKTNVEIDGAVIAKIKRGYIERIDAHGVTSSADIKRAIRFESIEEARTAIPNWIRGDVKFISADNAERNKEAKKYVISCGGGNYVKRVSSRHLFFVYGIDRAQKFTKGAAEKWLSTHGQRAWDSPITFEIVKVA